MSAERRELVFETIESQGGLSGLENGVGFEAFVSGPIVTNIIATPGTSPNDTYVADADTLAGPGLSIQVYFDEAMNTNVAPTLTLDGGNGSLTLSNGNWNGDATVFTQNYNVSDGDVDVDNIVVTVSGASDAGGNPQLLQKGPVAAVPEAEFNLDTENPDASTLSIVVDDTDQTEGDAATSFTVSTTDVDPGVVHVDMRGSEFTELDGIRTDYIDEVTDAVNELETARANAAGRESNIAGLETSLGSLLSTQQFENRTEIINESKCQAPCATFSNMSIVVKDQIINIEAEVHAAKDTGINLLGNQGTIYFKEIQLNGKTTNQMRRDNGYIVVRIPEGVHRISAVGILPNKNVITIPIKESHKAKYTTFESTDWTVDGIDQGKTKNSIQLTRIEVGKTKGGRKKCGREIRDERMERAKENQ